jgi:regulator of RNase E activity RraA
MHWRVNTLKYLPYELTREEMIAFTPKWKGERFDDGRPKVPDEVLDKISKYISITFAWGILKGNGYLWQFLDGFDCTIPGKPLVGRAVTALYAPLRPDLRQYMVDKGHEAGQIGDMISWPIDMLTDRDVYVGDVFGKTEDGPIVGERLSSAVYANSHNGAVHNAAVRDIDGIRSIEGFNIFYKGMNPTHASPHTIMLMGINCPMRMKTVTIMPGDVVLAKDGCVIFIPPHLAEFIALSGTIENYRDQFSMLRMTEKRYTPGQIDAAWTPEIEADFLSWLNDQPDVPFTHEDMERVKGIRTW